MNTYVDNAFFKSLSNELMRLFSVEYGDFNIPTVALKNLAKTYKSNSYNYKSLKTSLTIDENYFISEGPFTVHLHGTSEVTDPYKQQAIAFYVVEGRASVRPGKIQVSGNWDLDVNINIIDPGPVKILVKSSNSSGQQVWQRYIYGFKPVKQKTAYLDGAQYPNIYFLCDGSSWGSQINTKGSLLQSDFSLDSEGYVIVTETSKRIRGLNNEPVFKDQIPVPDYSYTSIT